MTQAEQFREYAEEAMQWAREARTAEAKKALVDLAFTWIKAAALRDRSMAGPPEQRV